MKDWKWYGSTMHFCCGDRCWFSLATELPNGIVVSTVGDFYKHDTDKKPTSIGGDWLFETMVFSIAGREDCGCPDLNWRNLDRTTYNTHNNANSGHLVVCLRWAAMSREAVLDMVEAQNE